MPPIAAPLWTAGILPALVIAGETPALPDSPTAHAPWFRGGRDAHAPRFADGVQADSSVDRGHLARIRFCGRDARAPRFADRPRSVVSRRARRPRSQIRGRRSGRFLRGARASCPHSFLRAGRPRSVFCPSEKARERASRRGVGPRIPGMNAGPKTTCGGKRPRAGVVGQPLAGDPRAIVPAAENEPFSPQKHVISRRAEYKRRLPVPFRPSGKGGVVG